MFNNQDRENPSPLMSPSPEGHQWASRCPISLLPPSQGGPGGISGPEKISRLGVESGTQHLRIRWVEVRYTQPTRK
ncbi:MAG: hypothetical protein F6K35_17355 [Okeania sp. SIO2H7]|nr:hypothetical protein [Okeania sp. SIO2H7]